jgi:preprotein translocase subunit SecE
MGVRIPPGLPDFANYTSLIGAEVKMIGKTNEFLANVKAELKKVTWPTKKETYASTTIVIGLVLLSAVYLGVVDFILQRLIRLVLG